MLYKNINRFDDICWHLPLYFILIVWLRFVNHLLNYYLLTYWSNFPPTSTYSFRAATTSMFKPFKNNGHHHFLNEMSVGNLPWMNQACPRRPYGSCNFTTVGCGTSVAAFLATLHRFISRHSSNALTQYVRYSIQLQWTLIQCRTTSNKTLNKQSTIFKLYITSYV